MAYLGVNVDHVATVREARKTYEPDPVAAAFLAIQAGAEVITIHLREDRRHIQERDLRVMRETVPEGLNLEISCEPEVVAIACEQKPDQATLVPEHRQEVTTEGGLDVLAGECRVRDAISRLKDAGIAVSLFLDPDEQQIAKAKELEVDAVELHTGNYALATGTTREAELERLVQAGKQCSDLGLKLHAGHGLNYQNVKAVAGIAAMRELNIGHSIVARAIFVGFEAAVAEMKRLIDQASC